MKRILIIVASALTLLFVISCGGSNSQENGNADHSAGINGKVSIQGMSDASGCVITAELMQGGKSASVNRFMETESFISKYISSESGVYTAVTDSKGEFSLKGLPDGTYTVKAQKEYTQGATVQNVYVNKSGTYATVTLDIVLTATGNISGNVTLADGGANYGTFAYAAGTSYVAAVDANGNYTISNIPVGVYTIVFYHSGYVTQTENAVTVNAAQTATVSAKVLAKETTAQKPFVVYTNPSANETDLSRSSVVTVVFNTDMNETTITAGNVSLKDSTGTVVAGTVTCSGNVVQIVPAGLLKRNEKYSINITPDAESTTGLKMGYTHKVYFTTVQGGVAVTYNGSGNTGGTLPAITFYSQNATVTVPWNPGSLVKGSAEFLGWSQTPAGASILKQGDTFTIGTDDVTLYARWGWKVTFDKNDNNAIGAMAQQVIAEGASVNLNQCAFANSGMTFSGWATTDNGLVIYPDRGSFTIGGGDIVLYAKWAVQSWIPINPGINSNGRKDWRSIASSSDGMRLAACVRFGYIYTSPNGGITWYERTAAGFRGWSSIASSSDGMRLAACVDDDSGYGLIYTSKDGGITWQRSASMDNSYLLSITSSSDGIRLAICGVGYIYTSQDAGVSWQLRTSAGTRAWSSIASSSDGMMLAATTNEYIYTSRDGGITWQVRAGAGSRQWRSITSSSDGIRLSAFVENGYIYTSQDGGVTWNERSSAGSRGWTSIASSSDGMHLVASSYRGDYIYESKDGGITWQQMTAAGSRWWTLITLSSDGMRLAACDHYFDYTNYLKGYIYTSQDGGVSWQERTGFGSINMSSVSSSSDGMRLAASVQSEYIYTSQDGGITWQQRTAAGSRNWNSITSSSDGMRLAATESSQYIYTSQDGGITWQQRTVANGSFGKITSSSDGLRLAACEEYGGYIHTSRDGGITWQVRTGAGSRRWQSITSSSDGLRLAACDYSNYGRGSESYIYTSQDGGVTWQQRTVPSNTIANKSYLKAITSSSDGMRLASVGYNYIYTSQDGGLTWQLGTVPMNSINSIATSSDGMHIVVCAGVYERKSHVCESKDGGITWEEDLNSPPIYWYSIAMSSDGSRIFGGNSDTYFFLKK